MATAPRPISLLRWWIGGLLFASTVIHYIDRQTLSLLAPYLKPEYHWTNSDYANIAIAFRVAYSVGQTVFGKVTNCVGTRRDLTLTVIWYSAVSMLTSLASGFYRFATFRFLLGTGESANWTAATEAVSEWFPKRERALATRLFDSGSSIGGAAAPFLVWWIYFRWVLRPTMANVLPSDLFSSQSLASVHGLSGTGAGIGTIVAFKLIGHYSDARQATGTHSFDPIVILAGLVPLVGMILVLLLAWHTEATNEGLVRRI